MDSSHGRNIACNSANTSCLNVYTNGVPVSGNSVTTWKTISGDMNQVWEIGYAGNGRLLMPYKNLNLALNIMRTSSSPTADLVANVYNIQGNYYSDTVLDFEYKGVVGANTFMYKFAAPARTTNGITYNRRYLAKTYNPTPVSDGNGTSNYVAFQPDGHIFYDIVIN